MKLTKGANTSFLGQSIEICWSRNPGQAELDISAFLLTSDRKVTGDEGMLFYGQTSVPGASVQIDQAVAKASFTIDLAQLDPLVQTIAICAALDISNDADQSLSGVGDLTVRAGDVSFDLDLTHHDEQALILVEIYRRDGAFKIRAVAQGYRGGLNSLAKSFGVDVVEDEPQAAPSPLNELPQPLPTPAPTPPVSEPEAHDVRMHAEPIAKPLQGLLTGVTSRLSGMIDYIIACEKEKLKLVTDVNGHRLHKSYKEVAGLPGVHFNAVYGGSNAWLQIERLEKKLPPAPSDALLAPWAILIDDTLQPPRLKSSLSKADCEKFGIPIEPNLPHLNFHQYELKDAVQSALDAYVAGPWSEWAKVERERRKSIALYGELFSLHEILAAPDGTPQEFICGIGFATLERANKRLRYPLITVQVEIELCKDSHVLSIIPREEVPPTLEHEPLDHMELRQVDQWSRLGRNMLTDPAAPLLSPFSFESYADILRQAAGLLDPEASFVEGEDGSHVAIPAVTGQLIISNSFAFIQRERSGTQLMADLVAYRSKLHENPDPEMIPGAIKALFTDPSDEAGAEDFPTYRGINSIPNVTSSNGAGEDLYFPKPFNSEQVQIAQRLAVRDGVVVQGPPGTGKTHTIANIISHYLATGKRVLVTAQKASALHVLKTQLPPAIRPLAVSLLDSDREGLREFQGAVELIAQRLQSMRVADIQSEITALETQIDGLHRKLARTDSEIDRLGRESLQSVALDDQMIEPLSAAQEILDAGDDAYWLPDAITTSPDYLPQFNDSDIGLLRDTRRAVGEWIQYFELDIPDTAILRDVDAIVAAHQDLANASELQRKIQNGEVWSLNPAAMETASGLTELCERIQDWSRQREIFNAKATPWDPAAQSVINDKSNPIFSALQALADDAQSLAEEESWFLTRPIEIPAGATDDPKFQATLNDLRNGGTGLGAIAGLFASKTKQNIAAVRIKGKAPAAAEEWEDVARFINANDTARTFAVSWNHALSGSGLPQLINTDLSIGREALGLLDYFKNLTDIQDEAGRLTTKFRTMLIQWPNEISRHADVAPELSCIQLHLDHARLAEATATQQKLFAAIGTEATPLHLEIRSVIEAMGNSDLSAIDFRRQVDTVQAKVLHLHSLEPQLDTIDQITQTIEKSGASSWADALCSTPVNGEDPLCPADWSKRWRLRRLSSWLDNSPKHEEFRVLHADRQAAEEDLARAYTNVIEKRTWLALKKNASQSVMSSLQAYSVAVGKIGKGTGKDAERHRQTARKAANGVKGALPCWIMPHYKVSESLPSEFGIFDLVIVDEASQSNLSALPALFRANQILIVGDDKQVSPDNVGLDGDKANRRAAKYLAEQVPLYAAVLREESSLYDVGSVIFGADNLMLREHFRSVAPIIEYSKKHFYRNELRPLRLSKASERLDPVLIDVRIMDGVRDGKINRPEAEYIISELRRMGDDPAFEGRTFGVTTLLGTEQAALIHTMIHTELGIPFIEKHNVRVGDPAAFQGDERDIMFLSLVVSPGQATAITGKSYDQRFNVAASRARERMILVRSVDSQHLSPVDGLRRNLIEHFHSPFAKDAIDQKNARDRCESGFEFEMFDLLTERGYQVDTQINVGAHRIDMVVEGDEDRRLAIECDGDRYHGPDQWPADMARQRTLERAGWKFWRCFASRFVREKSKVAEELFQILTDMGIHPRTATERSRQYTEYREWSSLDAKSAANDVREIIVSADATQLDLEPVTVRGLRLVDGKILKL